LASTADFAFKKFAEYYGADSSPLHTPSDTRQREFGFLSFRKATMLRHTGFETEDELKTSLASIVPSDAYYSSAYYERPKASMNEKGWLGADLIFDIDADHIPTPCEKIHDSWVCSNCSFAGKGPSPEKCPACGEARFDAKTWICDVCLESAKSETIKLMEMLTEDFGFADSEIKVYFSGNRGYHVHVESENVKLLDSLARKEIVDYIIGLGFKTELHRVIDKGRVLIDPDAGGWNQRVVKGLERFIGRAPATEMEATGLNKRAVRLLDKNREKLLESLRKNKNLNVKGVNLGNWKTVIEWIANQQSAKIDTVVTTDIHRLIRLAGSLHGKTGLMKAEASLSSFEEFDPLKEAVAFKDGQVTVDVTEAPEFRIGERVYGPFKNAAQVELPTAAALFLCCRGAAKVVKH
jgi:DNA primase small subunit